MNNLAYANQKQDEIADKVEQLLRKEIGGVLIPYEIETNTLEGNGPGPANAKTMLQDFWTALKGGTTTPLMTLHFHVNSPKAFDLDVQINRQGAGCYAGPLVYTAHLGKAIAGEVALGEDGKFSGDATVSERLNANKQVLKMSGAFAMTQGGISGFELKIPRLFKMSPLDGKTRIVAATLPRSKSMGFSATFNSKEFLELVSQLEAGI